jgi:hypothetical protein
MANLVHSHPHEICPTTVFPPGLVFIKMDAAVLWEVRMGKYLATTIEWRTVSMATTIESDVEKKKLII